MRFVSIFLLAVVVSCGGGGLEFDALDDVSVSVGETLSIPLIGAGSGDLKYQFAGNSPTLMENGSITVTPAGIGMFRWKPSAEDLGDWLVDFSVSDGSGKKEQTITVTVQSTLEGQGRPIIRRPLGSGTTIDLDSSPCTSVEIVVEDQDSTSVEISVQEELAGLRVEQTEPLTATLEWCVTESQQEAKDRYLVTILADDGDNPPTMKEYLFVLRDGSSSCGGSPPVISHQAQDINSAGGITLAATIEDNTGLKDPPILYYSFQDPGANINLGSFELRTMHLLTGSMVDGVWTATIPSPVTGMPAGSTAPLYYLFSATDADEPCNHTVENPLSGAFEIAVTKGGVGGNGDTCDVCYADSDCGGSSDLCVFDGANSENLCLPRCGTSSDCPTDFVCSSSDLVSVDGESDRVCVPISGNCSAPGIVNCQDDVYEENDTMSEADIGGELSDGNYDLNFCPDAGEEDWYPIEIFSERQIAVEVIGQSGIDVDAHLVSDDGDYLESSISLGHEEAFTHCASPGTYYVRVNAYGGQAFDYTMDIETGPCPSTCIDDGYEEDDTFSQARFVTFQGSTYETTSNQICAGDPDVYELLAFDEEDMLFTAEFTHADGDIDIRLYNQNGDSVASSLSASDDESIFYTADCGSEATCSYYLVVEDYGGIDNDYDMYILVD